MSSYTPTDTGIVTNGRGMPVILYLRKSNKTKAKSRDETVSIQQQRAELRTFCEARGWVIVGEYVDDGRSASKNESKRVEFARMLIDCENAGFRAVVVWDLSRLTRKDSVDAGKAASVFKAHHLLVESLRDGEIDLTSSMGRHLWNMHAEANSEFALKISKGVIRGRGDSLRRGHYPHGKIPYGFRRQYWDGDRLIADMHRNEPAGKARHWATKIVPDIEEVKFAVKIIRDFATRDISIRGLAIELQKMGAPLVTKGTWSAEHVKDIIRSPVYVGDIGIGYSWGWQASVDGRGYEAHAHSPKEANVGACTAVIDRPTWERANQRLQKQQEQFTTRVSKKGGTKALSTRTYSGSRTHAGKSSPLSGVIFCGHCGKTMAKCVKRGVTRFTCSTAAKNSHNPTCKQWTVQEADLLPIFQNQLAEAVDFKLLHDLAAKPPEADAGQLARLDDEEARLTKDVKTAAKNLALADEDVRDDVQAVLKTLRTDLDRVKNTAHLIRTAGDKTELQRIADWWKQERRVVAVPLKTRDDQHVHELATTTTARPFMTQDDKFVAAVPADPDQFRGLLKRLDARLTLHFVPKTNGKGLKKQFYAVEWGRLEATLDGNSFDATGSARRTGRRARRRAGRCGRAGGR